jgi:hypothetical protein
VNYCASCGIFADVEPPAFWCRACGEAWRKARAAKEAERP